MTDILQLLDGKWEDGTRPKDLYTEEISKSPGNYIKVLIEGLNSGKKKVQSGCAEIASLLSEDSPELLYPYIDMFLANINAKEPVLRWEAVCTLGNLASVDKAGRIRSGVDKMKTFLTDKSIVLQGHSVRALVKASIVFPDLAQDILTALIQAETHFPGNRVGFLVEAMGPYATNPELATTAKRFVQRFLESDVKSVAGKARKVMKRFE